MTLYNLPSRSQRKSHNAGGLKLSRVTLSLTDDESSPRIKKCCISVYPADARRAGITGDSMFMFAIDDGDDEGEYRAVLIRVPWRKGDPQRRGMYKMHSEEGRLSLYVPWFQRGLGISKRRWERVDAWLSDGNNRITLDIMGIVEDARARARESGLEWEEILGSAIDEEK
jgi:hypothetical protein